jgi:uncharacterized protein with NRDE domain
MCLLAIFFRVVDDAPLVVGANREEAYARGGEPPQIIETPCRAVAGLDPVAGGTWLGLNEYGLVIAVTNRRRSKAPAQPRSRGLLARDLLGRPSAREAAELAARELGQDRYAGCNVVCADPADVIVLQLGEWLQVRPMPPGIHVLTNRGVNDDHDPRIGHSLWWLSQRNYATARDCVAALQELCGQTGDGGPPICFRGPEGGTVSSSLIAVRSPLARSSYLHAQGPPDRTPYADYSYLIGDLVAGSRNGS